MTYSEGDGMDIAKADQIKKEWSRPGVMEHDLEAELEKHEFTPSWIPAAVRVRYQGAYLNLPYR